MVHFFVPFSSDHKAPKVNSSSAHLAFLIMSAYVLNNCFGWRVWEGGMLQFSQLYFVLRLYLGIRSYEEFLYTFTMVREFMDFNMFLW